MKMNDTKRIRKKKKMMTKKKDKNEKKSKLPDIITLQWDWRTFVLPVTCLKRDGIRPFQTLF